MVAKEGWQKAGLGEYHTQRQALSRFSVGALVLTDPVVDIIRRELRRISPGVKIDAEEIRNVLLHEVLKREVVEGEKADQAKRQINRAAARALRTKTPRDGTLAEKDPPTEADTATPTLTTAED